MMHIQELNNFKNTLKSFNNFKEIIFFGWQKMTIYHGMRGMLSCVLTIKFISPCYGFHGRDGNILHNHFFPIVLL